MISSFVVGGFDRRTAVEFDAQRRVKAGALVERRRFLQALLGNRNDLVSNAAAPAAAAPRADVAMQHTRHTKYIAAVATATATAHST